jgi:hypothetical protein
MNAMPITLSLSGYRPMCDIEPWRGRLEVLLYLVKSEWSSYEFLEKIWRLAVYEGPMPSTGENLTSCLSRIPNLAIFTSTVPIMFYAVALLERYVKHKDSNNRSRGEDQSIRSNPNSWGSDFKLKLE